MTDAEKYARSCPECVIATGVGRRCKSELHPIPVQKPFQVLGIDIMDLPLTERRNRHVVVILDLFSKWPLVFPVPDQKAARIARLVAEEVVPVFGVPESLLSDRGTNLLSKLVQDLCRLLGISKLNITGHHPQCDGAVERFNRTIKTMLRKHAARFGNQWDTYLPGLLWACRNTPHTFTGEKPSFLLFGIDCRTPTEAAFLPAGELKPTDLDDYREQLMILLKSTRDLAASTIRKAQAKYKKQYNKHARPAKFKLGQWVFVKFPQDEAGRLRKLSRPWHGPYRIVDIREPDVTVYYPQHGEMRVHMTRVCPSPENFPAAYYWYGGRQQGAGRPPRWVDHFLNTGSTTISSTQNDDRNTKVPQSTEIELCLANEDGGSAGDGGQGSDDLAVGSDDLAVTTTRPSEGVDQCNLEDSNLEGSSQHVPAELTLEGSDCENHEGPERGSETTSTQSTDMTVITGNTDVAADGGTSEETTQGVQNSCVGQESTRENKKGNKRRKQTRQPRNEEATQNSDLKDKSAGSRLWGPGDKDVRNRERSLEPEGPEGSVVRERQFRRTVQPPERYM